VVDEALDLYTSRSGHAGPTHDLSPPGQPFDFASAARVLVARSLRARRPRDQVDGAEAFRESVVHHVLLLLDLRRLHRAAPDPGRARTEIAGFLAGAVGEDGLALAAANDPPSAAHDRAVERALAAAGKRLRSRFFPPGDPRLGLPMNSGNVAVFRRHLARVAGGFARSATACMPRASWCCSPRRSRASSTPPRGRTGEAAGSARGTWCGSGFGAPTCARRAGA